MVTKVQITSTDRKAERKQFVQFNKKKEGFGLNPKEG